MLDVLGRLEDVVLLVNRSLDHLKRDMASLGVAILVWILHLSLICLLTV